MPLLYLPQGKMRAFSRLSRFGITLSPLTGVRGADIVTWFREVSLAPIYPLPEKERESTVKRADSGTKWQESLAKFDHATSSWKTRQLSFGVDLTKLSVTWPRWGMMRNGECWALPTLVPRTNASESGSVPHWPTPQFRDFRSGDDPEGRRATRKRAQGWSPGLNDVVRQWPTPTSTLGTHGGLITSTKAREGGTLIKALSARRWPTPTVSDGKGAGTGPNKQGGDNLRTAVAKWPTPACQDANKASKKMRDGHQNNLIAIVFNSFPTPTKRDYKGGYRTESLTRKDGKSRAFDVLLNAALNGQGSETTAFHLSPDWVELLMGWPKGWTSLQPMVFVEFELWATGNYWPDDWERETPRVCESRPGRINRLKAIGNGQVPVCAATAWRLLTSNI